MDPNSVSISCLTVSRPARLDMLRHAIDDFAGQTHPRRELIIVVDEEHYARDVDELVRTRDATIYLVTVSKTLNIGALRNISLQHSHGDLVCQWDDDDRYSPERLALQARALCDANVSACFLYQQLHFFNDTRELFLTDWRLKDQRPVGGLSSIIPGTVMCTAGEALYPEEGALAQRGEDSVYAARLLQSGAIGVQTPAGTYLRIYHSANCWDRAHHREIAVRRSVAAHVILSRRADIEAALTHFQIHPPVKVMAGARIVFEW